MHVQGIKFMVTVSHNVKYTTIKYIQKKNAGTFYKQLKYVSNLYHKNGYKVKIVIGGKAFDCIENKLAGVGIDYNVGTANEHAPVVERQIRVIKERLRSAWHRLPFEVKPKIMVIYLARMMVL